MKIRVYYEDTDAGGVVYHSRYLNFCERARSELFFDKYPHIFDAKKGHFLLARASCSFLKPSKLGDLLEVKSDLLQVKKASLLVRQEIFKAKIKLFSADFTLAFIKDERAVPMSAELKEALKSLFNTP